MNTEMKILIAYDGINPIGNIINDLKRSGLPKNAEVAVLTAVDNDFIVPNMNYTEVPVPDTTILYVETMQEAFQTRLEEELKRAEKTVQRAVTTFKKFFPGWILHTEACVDSPANAILEKEDKWKPDLVVVGSHKGSRVIKFFLGSVAHKILLHSKCSVHIVRKHINRKASRILVAFDGSPDSQLAVITAGKRTWPKGTLIRIVTAFTQEMSSAVAFRSLPTQEKGVVGEVALIESMMAPAVKVLRDENLKVSTIIKAGTPWKIITDEAEKWGANCIFVGARGLGRVDRFLLGSVSNAVATRAKCSVEVVRREIML